MASNAVPYFGRVSADGRLELDRPQDFKRHLSSLAGERVEIVVRKRRSKRSLDQNAWLWGVALPHIAEHCGYDRHEHDQLHYELLARCFGTVELPSRIPGAPMMSVPARTSSQLTTAEFSEYMDWLVRFAATDLGVVIPLPDEVPEAAHGMR